MFQTIRGHEMHKQGISHYDPYFDRKQRICTRVNNMEKQKIAACLFVLAGPSVLWGTTGLQ